MNGRVAVVGGCLTGFVAYLTLRRGGIQADEITVFAPERDPAGAWRRRARSECRRRIGLRREHRYVLDAGPPRRDVRDEATQAAADDRDAHLLHAARQQPLHEVALEGEEDHQWDEEREERGRGDDVDAGPELAQLSCDPHGDRRRVLPEGEGDE